MVIEARKLEDGGMEYIMEKAIVRIHPGKLTEEQRKVVLENAARDFYKAIQKQKAQRSC